MLFPKHPRLMTDDELCDWAKSLIDRQAPESGDLDYKAEISIEGKGNRIELGKDISSFANEGGGILLYGVPEMKDDNGVPIPKDLSECGIEIPMEPIAIENILLSIVAPPLPELEIRVLNLKELDQKSLLLIYHPASWNKPHMVQGYKHVRYYRRLNFGADIMEERQVEAAYSSRRASLGHADEFFKTGDFRDIPEEGRFFRVILCPRFTLTRRQEMHRDKFDSWRYNNYPLEPREIFMSTNHGEWIPFLDGWSFRGYPGGKFHGKEHEFRLFHNGGICFTMDLDSEIDEEGYLKLPSLARGVKDVILYCEKVFDFLRISGPLSMQVSLHHVKGLNVNTKCYEDRARRRGTPQPIEKDSFSYVEETSVDELRFYACNVLRRLTDRLDHAFGIWQERA